MNKFNIKKLVKISAVALAMISAGGVVSTVNANTNVHADSVTSKEWASMQKIGEQGAIRAKRDEDYAAYHAAKSDPSLLAYDLTHARDRIKGHEQELINDLTPSQKVTVRKDMAEDDGAVDPSIQKYENHLNEVKREKLFGAPTAAPDSKSKMNAKPTVKHHVAKHAHLSKASVRRIMRQIRLDKKAIRNDKKQLSTRNGKKFIKSMNQSKRATHVKSAKRYARYYKDEVKHEKDLARLTKSVHASKSTKSHARRSLKHVRKNSKHKHMKRSKVTRHHHKISK